MEKNTSETLYSLKFAERVRSVELGPGPRRAELASWSSQEHLEVQGWLMSGSGSTGSELAAGAGGRGCSQNLNPNPVASLVQVFLGLRGTYGVVSWLGGRWGAGWLRSDEFASLRVLSHLTLTVTEVGHHHHARFADEGTVSGGWEGSGGK